MLSQRLLDIIRIFNNPSEPNIIKDFELIPQDIDFLRQNGLTVEIIKNNSVVALCRVSKVVSKEAIGINEVSRKVL